ncbi:MAG TPA: hypothetical protein PLS71_25270, partial [Leptospiraceae bacterium]|nr:hypothetical protein [Leptospiraceae bacterium]
MLLIKNKIFTLLNSFLILLFLSSSLFAEESVLFIQWEDNPAAVAYIVEISNTNQLNQILFSKKVNEAVILVEADPKYKFARVAGVDKFGSIGEYSEVFPLKPRIISQKKIPSEFKDIKIHKAIENSSNTKGKKETDDFKKISDKRIQIKNREKLNNEIFSKIAEKESNLNLILKNIYIQKSKLNELELEILEKENLEEKDFENFSSETSKILSFLKEAEHDSTSSITQIEQEIEDSQKATTSFKKEIDAMNGKFSQKDKISQLEEKLSEVKNSSEEETERLEDLRKAFKSLNKKKSNLGKQIKNLKKEVIFFQNSLD